MGRLAIAGIFLVAVVTALVWFFFVRADEKQKISIATGAKGGTYVSLGAELAEILNREIPGVEAVALESAGSRENMDRLESGAVQLALVQNDTPGGAAVRSIAPLYDEVLHVVVQSSSTLDDTLDLAGKRVAIGAQGSGTEVLVKRVLEHFGVLGTVKAASLGTMPAVEAFERGELDAACFLSGLKSPAVERLLASGRGRLLSLGDPSRAGSSLDGLRVEHPYLSTAVIPARSYAGAAPREPVGTIAVKAVLVASKEVPAELVRDIARVLFANKVRLAERHKVASRLTERFDPAELRYPLHEGAEAYFTRDRPSFFVEYADAISLAITVGVGFASGVLALREWLKRVKKNRIDVFYLEVEAIAQATGPDTTLIELYDLRERLYALRRKAFEDLVAETLAADESFTIFQDFLRTSLTEIDDRIAEGEAQERQSSGERKAAAEASAAERRT
jgi:uncharacterized protein